ncbi:phosphoenolpyruvate--protein phosphotransferase [Halobacteriovorax sp.]|uniref:phosphoenolpyruvate--protein phosphotransferase n=1 Tax=Halobacteriovorax sp. TaxID=2020862 RepID=UPI003567B88C
MIGRSASPGFAYGKILVLEDLLDSVEESKTGTPSEDITKLIEVTSKVIEELNELSKNSESKDQKEIFEAHSMLANDPGFKKEIIKNIEKSNFSLAFAVKSAGLKYMAQFEALEDDYFKERALDIKDITCRFLSIILDRPFSNLKNLNENVILVGKDLTPSQTSQINKEFVKGFITELGGVTSHTAIIARTIQVPAIVGVKNLIENVLDKKSIAMDGLSGKIHLDPSEETISLWNDEIVKEKELRRILDNYKNKESITSDGEKLSVLGNISSIDDAKSVSEAGAEGVGLLRTEFLFMETNSAPSEEKQYQFYKEIAEIMGTRPVTIRTLDIGGDKEVSYLNLEKEDNPFLGYRAIRICLDRVDLFKDQLRAILRASAYGNLKIMLPMIATCSEIRKAKVIIEECKTELREKGISFNESIPVGIMIEIPAAAIMADQLAKEVDFFSIGTNDLIQYTIAVDRMNDKIADLYSFYDPSVIRLIKMTIDGARKSGIEVGMCGSMASELTLTELLVGLGLTSFSVTSGSVTSVRKNIIESSKKNAQELIPEILESTDRESILAALERL